MVLGRHAQTCLQRPSTYQPCATDSRATRCRPRPPCAGSRSTAGAGIDVARPVAHVEQPAAAAGDHGRDDRGLAVPQRVRREFVEGQHQPLAADVLVVVGGREADAVEQVAQGGDGQPTAARPPCRGPTATSRRGRPVAGATATRVVAMALPPRVRFVLAGVPTDAGIQPFRISVPPPAACAGDQPSEVLSRTATSATSSCGVVGEHAVEDGVAELLQRPVRRGRPAARRAAPMPSSMTRSRRSTSPSV